VLSNHRSLFRVGEEEGAKEKKNAWRAGLDEGAHGRVKEGLERPGKKTGRERGSNLAFAQIDPGPAG